MAQPKNSTVAFALELMQDLGILRARAMFGGWGIYCDDRFFALVSDDILYFKADDQNRAEFEEVGSQPFAPASLKDGKSTTMNYFRAPDEVWDDASAMMRWANLGVEAADRAAAKKTARKKAPS